MTALALRKKSQWSEQSAQRALLWAARAFGQNLVAPCPVMHAGELAGFVGYEQQTDRIWCASPTSVDSLITAGTQAAPTAGKIWINKYDFNGQQGGSYWDDLWPVDGDPVGGTYPGAAATAYVHNPATEVGFPSVGRPINTAAGETRRNLTGGDIIEFNNFSTSVGICGNVMVYDRILVYCACPTVNGTTTMTNTVLPTRGGSGHNIQIMITGQTAGASAARLLNYSYIPYGGSTPSTVTLPTAFNQTNIGASAGPQQPAAVSPGSLSPQFAPFLPFAAGDQGAYQLSSYTFDTTLTFNWCFVLAKPVVILTPAQGQRGQMNDLVKARCVMRSIPDDACLSMIRSDLNTGSSGSSPYYVNLSYIRT